MEDEAWLRSGRRAWRGPGSWGTLRTLPAAPRTDRTGGCDGNRTERRSVKRSMRPEDWEPQPSQLGHRRAARPETPWNRRSASSPP